MKCVGKIAIWLAGGLALSAGAQADSVVSADNPYTPIVTRNIFGLNAIQATETTSDPPPKITLNGIMSVFEKAQVLFKVAGTGKPGQPAKDQSYILSEGQRQDDIEVVHIDDKASLVTFNNHGTVQDIPLASAPVVTTPGPAGPGGQGGQFPRPHFGRPAGGPGGGNAGNGNGINRLGGGGQNRGGNGANPGGPYAAAMGGGSTMQSSSGGYSTPQQPQDNMTPEERAAALYITTEQLKSQGNQTAQIMPPVPMGLSGEK